MLLYPDRRRGRVIVASGRERPNEAMCGRSARGASRLGPRDIVGTSRDGESGPIGHQVALPRKSLFFVPYRKHLADSSELTIDCRA